MIVILNELKKLNKNPKILCLIGKTSINLNIKTTTTHVEIKGPEIESNLHKI